MTNHATGANANTDADGTGRLLIIFSKNPVRGRVKTRLALSTGEDEALRIYELLRERTFQASEKVTAHRAVFYSDFIPETDLFLTGRYESFLQKGADLGERMHHAFTEAFSRFFLHVVLIGTDCPELDGALINQAFACLQTGEVVIGPASDGGFYLIGLNRPISSLFLHREWSTSGVLAETIRILKEQKTEYALLPVLSDIDTFEDLKNSCLWNLQH